MADQAITDLNELLQANVEAQDVLPIVSIGESETKKVRVDSLIGAGLALIPSGTIDIGRLDQSSATKLGTTALADSGITAIKFANDSSIFTGTTAPASDNFEGRGFFNTVDGAFNIYNAGSFSPIVISASGIANDAVSTSAIADGSITTAKIFASGLGTAALASGSVTTTKIADNAITESKLAAGAVTTSIISDDAVTAGKLANDAVDTGAILDGSVTESKIANSAITTNKINDAAITNVKIANETVAYSKLNLSDGDIPAAKITDASIGTVKIANAAITTIKIDDGAVNTPKIADASISSAKFIAGSVNTSAIATSAVEGSKIADSAVSYSKIQAVSATDRLLGRSSAGSGIIEEIPCTSAGRNILAAADASAQRSVLGLGTLATADGTWTNGSSFSGTSTGTNTGDQTIELTGDVSGLGTGTFATTITNEAISTTKIASLAVTTAKINTDAVTGEKIADNATTLVQAGTPTGSGLFIGQQYINTTNDSAYYWTGSAWEAQTVAIPIATDSVSGTVKVGTGLQMNETGQLDHLNNIAAGTYTKITLDAQGHATNATVLNQGDIPNLDASKITTGTFSSAFLAANSVTAEQLADNGIAQISETAPIPQFAGQWWVNPSDRSTYIWVGSVGATLETSNGYWLNLGYGNLQQENLRFGGTYNASGATVQTVTAYSTQAGIDIGEALPTPSATNNGLYYIATASGVGTGNAPNQAISIGDWVVSLGQGTNWQLFDFGSAVAGVSDQDVLVNGPALVPAASGIATQEKFNEDVWTRVQVATTGVNGIVRASTEIAVSASGVMTIGIADDGTY